MYYIVLINNPNRIILQQKIEGAIIIKNNIEVDVKVKCIEAGMT